MKAIVAPLAGARIEMANNFDDVVWWIVAPLAGARIEIIKTGSVTDAMLVAPLAGARIEIRSMIDGLYIIESRSPRGSAD